MERERKLELMGIDLYPIVKEISFGAGICLGSAIIGYLFVSGRWKSCKDIYQVVESRLTYPK